VDIADVKQELSSDEKILESAFKLETLYKKYKIFIWGTAAAILLFFIGSAAMEGLKNARLSDANEALLTLQKNADDAAARKTLQSKNPALFELFTFREAVKKKDTAALKTLASSQNEVVSDASSYVLAALERKESDSKLYKEMSKLEGAYLDIKAGKMEAAREKLELIDARSAAAPIATLLKHAAIKAK